uniref:Ig-like domain-containing protein n=1 Tax=uncultured Rubinisphaera sp. TaxID=1678686 RepID=UPI0030D9C851
MLLRHWLEYLPGKLSWISRFKKLPRRRFRRRPNFHHASEVLETRQLLSATAIDDEFTIHYAPGESGFPLPVRQNDTDASAASLTLVNAVNDQLTGSFGTVEIVSGILQYTPGSTHVLQFQFEYQLDGTSTALVTVNTNRTPTLSDDNYSTGPGESVTLNLLNNDSDPDGNSISIVSVEAPVNGSISLVPDVSGSTWNYWLSQGQNYYSNFEDWYNSYYNYSGSNPLSYQYEYTPDVGFSGNEIFDYTVQDSEGGTSSASVTVTVAANQAPDAVDDTYSVGPGESVRLDLLANDTDPEGHAISLQSVAEPANGSINLVPDVSESTWNYWLNQGQNYYSNFEDWYNSYYGYSGSPLNYVYEYTPDQGFSGDDAFDYVIVDAHGATASAGITVTVAVNQAPTPVDDAYSVVPGQSVTLNLLANDSDPEGHTVSIVNIADPANGAISLAPNVSASTWNFWLSQGQNYYSNFEDWYNSYYNYSGNSPLSYRHEYTPDQGFSGDDIFNYTVVDSQGAIAVASVTVTVLGNDAPVANTDQVSVAGGQSVT